MKPFLLTLITLGYLLPATALAAPASAHVSINGLICDYCAQSLTKLFGKRSEVAKVDVDLSGKSVHLEFHDGQSIDDATITQLITDSGYDVVAIKRPQP
jgi:copper chaperone CopZ